MVVLGLLIAQLFKGIVRYEVMIFALSLVVVLLLLVLWLNKVRLRQQKAILDLEASTRAKENRINALLTSNERTKQQLAEKLKSDFTQLISVLRLNLSPLKTSDRLTHEKQLEIFKNSESVLHEMEDDLKVFCFDLMPSMLMSRGLTSTLKELGRNVERAFKADCKVLVQDNLQRLSANQELSLFRVAQIWIYNIIAKAEADNIRIQLTRGKGHVLLTIDDNGEIHDPDPLGATLILSHLEGVNGSFEADRLTNVSRNKVVFKLLV